MTNDPSHDHASPGLKKASFIADFTLGSEIADIFILAAARQGQARNGPYWLLEFKDASGTINGKLWSPQSLAFPELEAGKMMWVSGRITSYREKLELAVENMRILSSEEAKELPLADFMPASAHDPNVMFDELLGLCRKVLRHKPWLKLITSLLQSPDVQEALLTAPAAKSMHHAYAGGLLEHTLSVSRLCMRLAEQYPQLDRQLLLAGAICHDLGKLWELSSGLTVEYTQSGKLLGHIPLMLEKISPFIKKSGLDPDLAEHLQHLILSHHGTREYGSPVLPATAEALMLHYADNIDAKMQQIDTALSALPQGESGWSAYVPALERSLFRAMRTPEKTDSRGGTVSGQSPEEQNAEAPATQVKSSDRPLPLISQCSLLSKE